MLRLSGKKSDGRGIASWNSQVHIEPPSLDKKKKTNVGFRYKYYKNGGEEYRLRMPTGTKLDDTIEETFR